MRCIKCNAIFDIKDAAITFRKYGEVQIREKKCPECGGSFRAIELPGDLDKYLYNDDSRYYN